jgi:hypothetical protein
LTICEKKQNVPVATLPRLNFRYAGTPFLVLQTKPQVNKVIDTRGEYNKLGVTHVLCEMNIPTQQPLGSMLETMGQITAAIMPEVG